MDSRSVISTYRVQFSPNFSFADCESISGYLSALGVSHIYASPVLEAVKGSVHGYDQTDFTKIREELGSEEGLRKLARELSSRSIGWIQDIVPNHMAMTPENPMIYDILMKGRNSAYSDFFDIDWDDPAFPNGRVCLPFLESPLHREIEEGRIRVEDDGGLRIRYGSLELPLRRESAEHITGSAPGDGVLDGITDVPQDSVPESGYDHELHGNIMELLSRQHYALRYWRTSNRELNYRRFFAVNGLIGLRQEAMSTFEASHGKLFQLVEEGVIDGFRIDHIDGLRMPYEYLRAISNRYGIYTVVEKILGMEEELPQEWPVQGTSGYDFLAHANYLIIDRDGLVKLDTIYKEFSGNNHSPGRITRNLKLAMVETLFSGVLDRISRVFWRRIREKPYGNDATLSGTKEGIAIILSSMPVYRTYISPEAVREDERDFLASLASGAAVTNPGIRAELEALEAFIMEHPGDYEATEAIMLLQQYMPGVYAKSVEDTLFYTYNALISMNEVGSGIFYRKDPLEQFHSYCTSRALKSPLGMNALSTHDTKLSEDIRARISVISEVPGPWESRVKSWSSTNGRFRKDVNGKPCPSFSEEHYIYQLLLGSWPMENGKADDYMKRVKAHLLKSIREAGKNTTWDDPDREYEEHYLHFVDSILDRTGNSAFMDSFLEFQEIVSFHGAMNSLSQKIIQLTAPGVPDTYQGTEVWRFSFVDPDNRRPVDFLKMADMLNAISSAPENPGAVMEYLETCRDGRIKLFITGRLLNLRRKHPDLFTAGDYTPLEASGKFRECVVAFMRATENEKLIVVVPRLTTRLGNVRVPAGSDAWEDTAIHLPEKARGSYRNELTGEVLDISKSSVRLGDLTEHSPFAVLHSLGDQVRKESST